MINRTNQTVNKELSRRLPAVERAVRDFKNKQFIGSDSLSMLQTAVGLFTFTLAPGARAVFGVQFTGTANVLYQGELEISTFIDHDGDFNYRWPDGASLSSDQEAFLRIPTCDLSASDEVGSGIKTYFIQTQNLGISSKNVYLRYAMNFPEGATG